MDLVMHMRYTPTGNPRVHGMIHHTYTNLWRWVQIGLRHLSGWCVCGGSESDLRPSQGGAEVRVPLSSKSCRHLNPNHNIVPTFGPLLDRLGQDGDIWDVV